MPDSTKRILTDETGQDIVSALQSLQGVIDPNGTAVAAAAKIDNMTVAASGLAAGATPTATVSEVSGHKHIAFGIPAGYTPQLSIGTVSSVSHGSTPTVTLTGTTAAPVLNLGIPEGASGNESIDDTDGLHDDTTVWSADKNVKELAKKADVENYSWRESSGNPMTIDALSGVAKQVKVAIEPKQDLHGYDHPWVGGAGKNQFDPSKTESTVFSRTDGTFANTQTDSRTNFKLVIFDGSTWKFAADINATGQAVTTAFTIDNDTTYLRFGHSGLSKDLFIYHSLGVVKAGTYKLCLNVTGINPTVAGGLSFKDVMLIPSTETDTTFAPYSNICPITGFTGTKVTVTGKNYLDGLDFANFLGTPNITNKYVAFGFTSPARYYKLPFIKESTQYTFIFTYIGSGVNTSLHIMYTDGTVKSCIFTQSSEKTKLVITTTAGKTVDCLRFGYWDDATINLYYEESGIFEGVVTSGDFEPYKGNQYEISFPSAAGTVYGGTVTVNDDGTGTLTVDRKCIDLGNLTWSTSSSHSMFSNTISDIAAPASAGIKMPITSDSFETTDSTSIYYGNTGIAVHTDRKIRIKYPGMVENGTTFKAAMSGIYAVYPLASPTSYTLTAPQIKILLGTNHIYGDSGDITILYPYNDITRNDGSYNDLTAGNAYEVLSDRGDTDNEPYVYRKSGGSKKAYNRELLKKIVGGTVAWNQIVNGTVATKTVNGVTFTNSNGSIILNGTATADIGAGSASEGISNIFNMPRDNHVILLSTGRIMPSGIHWGIQGYEITNTTDIIKKYASAGAWSNKMGVYIQNGTTLNNLKLTPQCFDLTQMFGSTIADYIYSLEQATAGAGVAWFRKLFPKDYYEYNAGTLMSVKAVGHRLTGKNLAEDVISGYSVLYDGSISADSRYDMHIARVVKGKQYTITTNAGEGLVAGFYTSKPVAGSVSYNGTRTDTQITTFIAPIDGYIAFRTAANYATPQCEIGSTATAYVPYTPPITYPLDSSLELRGIPKLTSGNQFYYDGDEYTPDGKVKRKYGIVDLGTLTWSYFSTGNFFFTEIWGLNPAPKSNTLNLLCPIYTNMMTSKTNAQMEYVENMTMYPQDGAIKVKNTSYTDASTFTTAMSGVYLVYELATPTTEDADEYRELEICAKGGTEEFIDGGVSASIPTRDVAIPVGTETFYPVNVFDYIDEKIAEVAALASS